MPELNLMMPGNPRYQPKSLQSYFGYDLNFRYLAEVEIATLCVLAEIGIIPAEDFKLFTRDVQDKLFAITTSQVDHIERTVTKHDVRAWVRLAQESLPPSLRIWAHIPLTSYDALDTARTLQFQRAHFGVVQPTVKKLVTLMAGWIHETADIVQIGRTHGQHALPITVGFWLANILDSIVTNARQADENCLKLRGKISGAVGAYNAQVGLGISARCGSHSFEWRVLEKLNLEPADISSQILPPEPLAYYLFSCLMLSSVLGKFGRDCRNLMRSEIDEIAEGYEEGQVGSSTMPQKRNPINFENEEGTWLKLMAEFQKVLLTLITDHQRDLVASSLYRDFPAIVVDLVHQLETLLKEDKKGIPFLKRIRVNRKACERNFAQSAHLILAEPISIALQMYGYSGDAHKLVNEVAVPKAKQIAERRTGSLFDVICDLGEADLGVEDALLLKQALSNIPREICELLVSPREYTGLASQKARAIADKALAWVDSLTYRG